MRIMRDIFKVWTISLIMFASGGVNAWAVVPYSVNAEQTNAEQVQREKQEIIKSIEGLEKQNRKAVKEIINELNQIVDKDTNSLPSDGYYRERY